MRRSFEFELDSGIRGLGGPLKFALVVLATPFAVAGVALLLPLQAILAKADPRAVGFAVFLLAVNVLFGFPLALFLFIGQFWVVRRVRLTISPEDRRWYLERQTVYFTSRREGDVRDIDHVDVERGSWGLASARLVGCHESTLAEVICENDMALRPDRGGHVTIDGATRVLTKGDQLCEIAEDLRAHVHAALGKGGTGAVRRRA